jgi:phosphohistidine phosphatase
VDVFLIRHAAAEDHDPTRWAHDSQRPLSPQGRRVFARFVKDCGRLPSKVAVLAASPYVRAQETARILVDQLGWPKAASWPELQPETAPNRLLARLAKQDAGSVALVSHEPLVSSALAALTTGTATGPNVAFDKGTIAHIEIDDPSRPPGTLRWFLGPH